MKEKIKVNKVVYSIDIETSTVKDTNNMLVSFMYICGVGYSDITTISSENYKTSYTYEYYRDYKSLDEFFYRLDEQSKDENILTVVLIQNAEYEYSFFKRNLTFFSNNLLSTNQRDNKTLWAGTNSFKILQLENLVFIDTYLLSNMGLAKIGTQVGVEKLKELKTYKEIYTQNSVLPATEFQYNYNDCLIPLVFYANKLKETWCNDIYSKTDSNYLSNDILKMFTQTNSNKLFCKNNEMINSKYTYIDKNDKKVTSYLYKQLTNNFRKDSIRNYKLGNQTFLKSDRPAKLKNIRIIDKQNNRILETSKYKHKLTNTLKYKTVYFKYPTKYYSRNKSYILKQLKYKKDNRYYIRKSTKFINKYIDKQGIVLYLQDVFQGGFTYANPYFCYKSVDNVKSFDATSMYPFVMLIKYFPHCVDDSRYLYIDMLKTLKDTMQKNFQLQFGYTFSEYIRRIESNTISKRDYMSIIQSYINNINSYNLKHYVCTIVVKNLSNRILNKTNLISPLSSAKCRWRKAGTQEWYNCVHRKGQIELNNGKLKKIYNDIELEIKIDSVNMLLLMLFYSFEIVSCENLVMFTSNRRTEKYILKECVHFAKIKKELKPLVKKLENHELLTSCDIQNTSSNVFELIKNVTELKTEFEQFSYVNAVYLHGKQNFNGLFGINVQKLCPESFSIKYDREKDYIYCKKDISQYTSNTDRNYIYGMFIPAFARLHLFMFILFSTLVCNLDFIYCDTDSVKCTGSESDLKKWASATGESAIKEIQKDSDVDNWLNKSMNKYSFNGLLLQNKYYRYVINMKSDIKELELIEAMVDLGNLGLFENDGNYEKFATMGAKNYISYDFNKKSNQYEIHTTIAGVNKVEVSKAFTEYINSYEMTFNEFVEDIYRPNLIIENSIADKKYHCYYEDYKFNVDVIDDNGLQSNVQAYSGIVLTDIDVEIHRIDEHMTSSLIHFVLSKTLQNNKLTYKDIANMIPARIKLYRSTTDNQLYITDDETKFNQDTMMSPFVENVL